VWPWKVRLRIFMKIIKLRTSIISI
jgi:hypothetical protein